MSLILKRALHWAGSALALLGIAFVALRLRDYGAELDFSRFDTTRWSVVVRVCLDLRSCQSNARLGLVESVRAVQRQRLAPLGDKNLWHFSACQVCARQYIPSGWAASYGNGCRSARVGARKVLGVGAWFNLFQPARCSACWLCPC